MKRAIYISVALLCWSVATHAADDSALPANDRLPNDTVTVQEARNFVRDHELERDRLRQARSKVFARGAKVTPEERAKLIDAFNAEHGAALRALRANSGRAADLSAKLEKMAGQAKGN